MKKSPYDFDYENLPDSEEVVDPVSLLKVELGAKFCKITKNLTNNEVIEITGLHKADLSRIKVGSVDRFSLDRLIGLLSMLGYKATVKVVRDKEAS